MKTKTKIKIPKGWRRMRVGEKITARDKFWFQGTGPWVAYGDDGHDSKGNIGIRHDGTGHCLIRRRPLPRKAKKKRTKFTATR